MQTTLRSHATFKGIGLHSGRPVRMVVKPASSNFGIWFSRQDINDRDRLIQARFDCVNDTQLCTRICNEAGVEVSTVEHIMAALAGCGIHNAIIEVNGPEVPIMDGSSEAFTRGLYKAGIVELDAPLRAIEILKPIEVRIGDATARLEPSRRFEIDFEIDFADDAIGRQSYHLDMANGAFVRELSNCRTFCRKQDVDLMQDQGLALGGSLDNAIVVDGKMVLNDGGFRRADECVRHKMLDALGDLYLAGAPILGKYTGRFAGHHVTNELLRALMSDRTAWQFTTPSVAERFCLPGAELKITDFAA